MNICICFVYTGMYMCRGMYVYLKIKHIYIHVFCTHLYIQILCMYVCAHAHLPLYVYLSSNNDVSCNYISKNKQHRNLH